MHEHELLEKIKQSAEHINVPDALTPEQMQTCLDANQHSIRKFSNKKRFYKAAVTAACLCLCFGAGGAIYAVNSRSSSSARLESGAPAESDDIDTSQAAGQKNESHTAKSNHAKNKKDTVSDSRTVTETPVKKIGSMYTLASSYKDVYKVLRKISYEKDRYNIKEDADEVNAVENSTEKMSGSAASADMGAEGAEAESTSRGSTADYSTTNLQVQGVDESDIVKTDGRYIYVVQDSHVQVLDVQNKIPEKSAVITPDMNEDTDQICEMYIADSVLMLILQAEKTSMQQKEQEAENIQASEPAFEDNSLENSKVSSDVYRIDTDFITKVLTYDISDPAKPVLQDTATQDGMYHTSRKIGSLLYLFTDQSMYPPVETMRDNDSVKDGVKFMRDNDDVKDGVKDEAEDWIPSVNGNTVRADCIYLPEAGNQGLVISSFDLASHCKVLDTKLLVNDYTDLYVSQTSAYLYYTDYTNAVEKTRIARFALDDDGGIRAVSAASLKGNIRDTFAIHERNGYLQVLTSVISSDPWENRVYVLDEEMSVIGKLTGLAKNEEIYSARFVGTTGYFVTYRNTDPLFTVDFSDPKKPKVIGTLKVTGFSEYLHFWSDDQLLGIGYETDPDSGETKGVKLSMFDISNPAEVTEEARLVLDDADECAGMYNYKAVLVNLQNNVIALTTETYTNHYHEDYHVFSYDNKQFTSRVKRRLAGESSAYQPSDWRSLYVGDTLYLVNAKKAIAFDMNNWKEIGKLSIPN